MTLVATRVIPRLLTSVGTAMTIIPDSPCYTDEWCGEDQTDAMACWTSGRCATADRTDVEPLGATTA
jgi:hypothetical protein